MNIVIFGGTGDLATRKLLPALFRHHKSFRLPKEVNIIGIGRDLYQMMSILTLLEKN